ALRPARARDAAPVPGVLRRGPPGRGPARRHARSRQAQAARKGFLGSVRLVASNRRPTEPAFDAEAERAVLGAVLIDNAALTRVRLQPEDFAVPQPRLIWAAMQAMAGRQSPIDELLLANELGEAGVKAIGGLAAVGTIARSNVTAENIEHYAEIVSAHAL